MVYEAKCDDLLCAAKMLHPILGSDREMIRRFEQQCERLSTLRHPNIVQFIGTYSDPDTKLPVLLMELMDDNLTHFLEDFSHPVPYHILVNICHDVALALSYLHARSVVHRDVSSSCILLLGNNARVVKLGNFGSSMIMTTIHTDLDICPGKLMYMPPEALFDHPKYTEKIDCFSFGIIVIQVLTGKVPYPDVLESGFRIKCICYENFEIQRRQNHISKIDPQHPLLSIALDCLNDLDMKRPTAHELCERTGALKESEKYVQSKRSTDLHEQLASERQRHTLEQEHNGEEIYRLRENIKQQETVFENAERQRLASERELRDERQRVSEYEQQLLQNQEEAWRIEQELRQQQVQSSQRESELNRQILTEQQRARDQLLEKDERIQELERRFEKSEVEALGSRVTGLQLLPQEDSWNVPRREVRIIEQIGYGAAGLVSKGRYQGQEVAVKQIHQEILREKHIMDEFKREVGIMATIQHPNLVQFIAAVFDERVDQLRETPLLVIELLHTNLRNAYKDFDLGPSKSVPIFRDVAYGLHYLHEHSEPIIHRDVSAPNILLESLPGEMWRAKLSDFGSANFLQRAKTLGVGAIVYTAPEMFPQASPSVPMPRPTTKCDVFSYGIVVVEVVTKTMPTTENRHQLFGEVERKWRLMHDLVSRCTEVSPQARPTMADVLNTLNRIPMARPR
jgi:serine/threonine protein kinase